MDDLRRALDRRDVSAPVRFWLRDDDAVEPGPALDHLLQLTGPGVPLTLAVIPATTGQALADRLAAEPGVTVAVHGWSHRNHAPATEKKQELGLHRPVDVVLAELATGLERLRALHGPRCAPVLVPPWNRIHPGVVAGLPGLGYRALSVFGPEKPAPLRVVNTHVDLMDWHGTGGSKPEAQLRNEIIAAMRGGAPVGLLSHHLVHDAAGWRFLERLFAATQDHPGCRWVPVTALIGSP